jgi:cysteine synthase A
MPDNATQERVKILRAYGAEVHLTPAAQRMQGAIDLALSIAKETTDAFIPQQFENPANPDAHRTTTALEILEQMERRLDLFVLTAGTGGTVTGTGDVLKQHLPELKIYVVEPASSPVLSGGQPGPHKIPGTGPGFVPKNYDPRIPDRICHVTDGDAQAMARQLARTEGLLLGASGAAAVHIALEAAKTMAPGQRVLAIAPDSGERYLSSDLYA